MLVKMRWILKVLLALLVLAVFHYNLPQRDIVRITGTEILRKDLSGWTGMFYAAAQSGEAQTQNRDLRLINTVRANGKVSVYRNEDTGFNWPPYLKFDSSNLQAEAEDAVSSKEAPEWYILRHYGWRNTFWSIYPNAVSLTPVAGPPSFVQSLGKKTPGPPTPLRATAHDRTSRNKFATTSRFSQSARS